MGVLGNIFSYAISSMFLGIIFTILGLAVFFLLIKGWYKDRTFNIWSILVGMVLFFLLCYQNILLCGAYHIKGLSEDFKEYVEDYVTPWVTLGNPEMTLEQVDELLMGGLAVKYPIVAEYVGGVEEFYGYRASQVPQAVVDMINEYYNWYILRRALWGLFFIVVGAIIVVKTMEKGYTRTTRSSGRARETILSRHERVASRKNRRY